MNDSLITYLRDHLTGAKFAVELLESLCERQKGGIVGLCAAELLPEIEKDRQLLLDYTDRLSNSNCNVLRDSTAWLGQKMSELKLDNSLLGVFESLETLSLGIQGKLALWRALIAIEDSRVSQLPLAELMERAKQQQARVEECRLQWAVRALNPTVKPSP